MRYESLGTKQPDSSVLIYIIIKSLLTGVLHGWEDSLPRRIRSDAERVSLEPSAVVGVVHALGDGGE